MIAWLWAQWDALSPLAKSMVLIYFWVGCFSIIMLEDMVGA